MVGVVHAGRGGQLRSSAVSYSALPGERGCSGSDSYSDPRGPAPTGNRMRTSDVRVPAVCSRCRCFNASRGSPGITDRSERLRKGTAVAVWPVLRDSFLCRGRRAHIANRGRVWVSIQNDYRGHLWQWTFASESTIHDAGPCWGGGRRSVVQRRWVDQADQPW